MFLSACNVFLLHLQSGWPGWRRRGQKPTRRAEQHWWPVSSEAGRASSAIGPFSPCQPRGQWRRERHGAGPGQMSAQLQCDHRGAQCTVLYGALHDHRYHWCCLGFLAIFLLTFVGDVWHHYLYFTLFTLAWDRFNFKSCIDNPQALINLSPSQEHTVVSLVGFSDLK